MNISLTPERIGALAETMGVSAADLATILSRGASHSYKAGDYLYHESTPRLWMGIVEEGEIEIVRGLHGGSVRLATLTPGTGFSEGVMLEDLPHSGSAIALSPSRVWQIPRAGIDEVRAAKPELFYRMAGHIARRLSARLRAAGEQLSGVKKAAAAANCELGVLDRKRAEAIAAACDEIIAGKLHEHFTVDMIQGGAGTMIQGGAGTSTNMNANEVIANRALELLGHRKGEYQALHPNDHVNCSQSTNDVYPTAVKLGVVLTLHDTVSALRELQTGLKAKAAEFADVLKMGRTENQDAVPMTLGQELGVYELVLEKNLLTKTQLDDILKPENMTHPRKLTSRA